VRLVCFSAIAKNRACPATKSLLVRYIGRRNAMRKTPIWAAALLASAMLAAPSFAQSPIPDYQATTRKDVRDAREEGPTVNQLTAVDPPSMTPAPHN
jgi:hypothetical protein